MSDRLHAVTKILLVLLLTGCYGDAAVYIEGQVQDASGEPVSDAKVTLAADPSVYPGSHPVILYTSSDGDFSALLTLPAIGKPTATLTINAEGYEEYTTEYGDFSYSKQVIVLRSESANDDELHAGQD